MNVVEADTAFTYPEHGRQLAVSSGHPAQPGPPAHRVHHIASSSVTQREEQGIRVESQAHRDGGNRPDEEGPHGAPQRVPADLQVEVHRRIRQCPFTESRVVVQAPGPSIPIERGT